MQAQVQPQQPQQAQQAQQAQQVQQVQHSATAMPVVHSVKRT
jgi:hypothetical protein